MRILLLTHRVPFPPNKGDKIRSFNLLSYLARRHEVYVASLVDDPADLGHLDAVRALTRGFVYDIIGRGLRRLVATRGLLLGRPITVAYFYSRHLQHRIDELIDRVPFDCFFCYSSPMAEYLFRSRHAAGKIAAARRIMDLIDIDSYKWQQYAEHSPAWKSWLYSLEARHLASYERRIAGAFDRLFVVTEQERRHFPAATAISSLQALPNGVDLDFFTPRHVPAKQLASTSMVFTGVMDYWPNIEGVTWFVERILPRVRQTVPDAQLYIVGSKPTTEVQRLSRFEGVTVTGYVDDVRDYLAAASICVVPLRIARGIQNKILEAMAMGKAVATTTQAIEGVRAVAGEECAVAAGEEDFANNIVQLLTDGESARKMGARARLCAERFYRWDENLRTLSEVGL
jgi:sugar transferase (PEP-CTERM/EpsH1 system associated)